MLRGKLLPYRAFELTRNLWCVNLSALLLVLLASGPEHGSSLDNDTLDLMVKHGTFFDPNLSTTYNYFEHKKEYLGIGNYNEEGFTFM